MILLFLCKDYASERNESLLSNCRAQLIFCKDYASERNEILLSNCRAQLILCKDIFFFRKMQGIIGKCLRVKEITEKAKKKGFLVVTIKLFMYFCKNKKPGVITSIE